MDKDIVIAAILGISVVLLIFSLVGVLAVTGYFYFSESGGEDKEKPTDSVRSIVDTVGLNDANVGAVDLNSGSDQNSGKSANVAPQQPPVPPTPVCGNKAKETGEQCEVDSECSSTQVCTECKCVDKPKPKPLKLDKLAVDSVAFLCVPNFGGKRGLGMKIFTLKNNGATDFQFDQPAELRVSVGEWADAVKTKTGFKFLVKVGKTFDIYPKDLDRADAPYLFLSNKVNVPLVLVIDFGEAGYVEHNTTLRVSDFMGANCL